MRSFSNEAASALALAASLDRLSKLIRSPRAKLRSSISSTVPTGRSRAVNCVEASTPKSLRACIVTAIRKMSHATKNHRAGLLPLRQLMRESASIAGADRAPRLTRL